MATEAEYLALLQGALPTGDAWPREEEAEITRILAGIAGEFARIHNRAGRLIEEADPRTTLELLPEWERVAGLPDPCAGNAETLQERRAALVQRLATRGGQDIPWFERIAAALGYGDIQFTTYRPFMCGISRCGNDRLMGGAKVRFNWRIAVGGPRVTRFRCGQSQCGIDRITNIDRAEDLECVFQRVKPAHTNLIFAYTGI